MEKHVIHFQRVSRHDHTTNICSLQKNTKKRCERGIASPLKQQEKYND
jgi:hypothetical protein